MFAAATTLVACFDDRGGPQQTSSTATSDTGADTSPSTDATTSTTDDPPAPTTTHACLETVWYLDADGDGYGEDDETITACDPPPGYAAVGGDCDPASSDVSPAQLERCDGVDNDCDHSIDEHSSINSSCNGCRTIVAESRLYYLCSVSRDWSAARLACNAYGPGTDLVVYHAEEEQNMLVDSILLIENEAAGLWWIGLGDAVVEGTFVWVDGSPLEFESWNMGEPNNFYAEEDCVHFSGNQPGLWNDIACSSKMFYICEGPL